MSLMSRMRRSVFCSPICSRSRVFDATGSGRSREYESERAANRGQRRSKLVAHGGHELGLQTLDFLELTNVVAESMLAFGDGGGERAERFTELPKLATSARDRADGRAMISRRERASVEHDRVERARDAPQARDRREHDHRDEQQANEQRFARIELDLMRGFSCAVARPGFA